MSDLQGWLIISFLVGVFSGIVFYMIKDVINQYKKIADLKKQLEFYKGQINIP